MVGIASSSTLHATRMHALHLPTIDNISAPFEGTRHRSRREPHGHLPTMFSIIASITMAIYGSYSIIPLTISIHHYGY
jgi:hypothetical protein